MAEKRGSVLDPLSWSDPIVRVYEACVDELLINLAKHFNVSAMGNIESFRYEVEMLAKMGAIRQETARIIARHIAQNEPMIEEALKTAMLDALETVEPELKHAAAEGLLNGTDMEVSDFVKSKLTSYSRQAKNQLNLVNTVMLEGTAEAYRKGVYAAVDIVRQLDAAQETLNVETGKVITGTSTLQQATRAAVKAMSQNGITGFVDRGGHRWSAEAYVRMDLKTTCSNAANRAVMDRNESYGNDLIWVRTNATARPGCYPWQGKVISMQDRARDVTDGNGNRVHAYAASQTTYGQPDGIFGINCHHGPMNVFVPGISYIRGAGTAPDQAENDRLYELTQQQRKLEREVRYAKRDAAMYDTAGDREAFEKAALKVKQKNAQLKAFVREHDSLVLRSDRTQVLGYNRSVSGKVSFTKAPNALERKVFVDGEYVSAMPKSKLQRIAKAYKRNGGKIDQTDEAEAFLAFRKAQGITLNSKTILLSKAPTRATVFEELIHSAQWRDGKCDGTAFSVLKCEVEAKKKLLQYASAYGLSKAEIRETKKLLKKDEEDYKQLLKGE